MQFNLGQTISHTKTLKDRRKETIERRVVETNKLIIRLGKVLFVFFQMLLKFLTLL